MKLGKDVLLEIVDLVRKGLVENRDISEELRALDLEESADHRGLLLSDAYLANKGRTRDPQSDE